MRGNRPTALGPRAAALLQRLLEQAGQPVSKEALIDAAWPGLVVEESNLTVQIAALRKVLGEAGGAAWIETLPRRGYRYVGPPISLAPTAALPDDPPALGTSDKPSVAVLPFADLCGDGEQAYFADGMVDDIVNGLSRIRWLFVIARSSTLKYRQQSVVDAMQAGRELGVRYLLLGSVRRASDRIRIACQLVEAASGVQVWSERYDRALSDVFDLQDEVAIAVVGAMEPTLRQAEARRVRRKRPDSLHAYEIVLQAQADVFSGMPEPSTRALGLLGRALALEPGYALAHAYAAMCYHNRFLRGGLDEADREASIGHARSAMANGQDDALALTFAGFSMGMDAHDRAAASAAFDAALAISPSSALTYILGSVVFGWSGQVQRAIEWGEKGLRLSPFDGWAFAAWHSIVLGQFASGRFDAAAEAATRAIQANPAHSISYMLQAAALAGLGRIDDARKAAATVMNLQPNFRYGRQFAGVDCELALAAALGVALVAAGLQE
ncbi:winged helix-turn-helix domain-containing protein [Variovorax sp. PBL-E5]|uniref:winged helix-turn-helix domain-containing protein n=1 Tax=Variovorax sp. PBL-E5 TaxID=434014 RepID=UPI001E540F86|nr:winged helix-turn-helix domain-containing protein [Variovorax sp. PBL-E5]